MTDTDIKDRDILYAGELRALGYNILDKIPDCAWVPRWSLKFSLGDVSVDKEDPTKVNMSYYAEFTCPFKWITFEVKVVEGC